MARRAKAHGRSKRKVNEALGVMPKQPYPTEVEWGGIDADSTVGARAAQMENYNRQRMIASATHGPLDFRKTHHPLSDTKGPAVEPLERSIPDARGGIGIPHRAQDTLAILLRNGTIRDQDHDAGRRFEEDFALACLNPLHASDPGRIPGRSQHDLNDSILAGRAKVRATMTALGGPATPVGSSVWCILGLGQSLKEWARNCQFGQGGRSLDERVAKGVFLAALSVLVAHYGTKGR